TAPGRGGTRPGQGGRVAAPAPRKRPRPGGRRSAPAVGGRSVRRGAARPRPGTRAARGPPPQLGSWLTPFPIRVPTPYHARRGGRTARLDWERVPFRALGGWGERLW